MAGLPFLFSDLGCLFGGYLAPILHNRLKLQYGQRAALGDEHRRAVHGWTGADGGFAANPIVAILCFSLGGYTHQMLSSYDVRPHGRRGR